MNQFLRSFLKVFLTIFLVVSLLSFVLSLSFYQFTSYDNLQPRFTSFIDQQIAQEVSQTNPDDMNYLLDTVIENCSGNREINFPIDAQSLINLNSMKINCSEINNRTTVAQMMGIASKSIFNSLYYKEYTCSFPNCVKDISQNPENLSVMVSKKANDFFRTLTITFLIISLIWIALLILLSKPKLTCFYNLSVAFIISGLFFMVSNTMTQITNDELSKSLIAPLAKSITSNFLILLILGGVFLVLGILLRIFKKK